MLQLENGCCWICSCWKPITVSLGVSVLQLPGIPEGEIKEKGSTPMLIVLWWWLPNLSSSNHFNWKWRESLIEFSCISASINANVIAIFIENIPLLLLAGYTSGAAARSRVRSETYWKYEKHIGQEQNKWYPADTRNFLIFVIEIASIFRPLCGYFKNYSLSSTICYWFPR